MIYIYDICGIFGVYLIYGWYIIDIDYIKLICLTYMIYDIFDIFLIYIICIYNMCLAACRLWSPCGRPVVTLLSCLARPLDGNFGCFDSKFELLDSNF
jgi:hypothetical protein